MSETEIVFKARDEATRVLNEIASSVDQVSTRLLTAGGLLAGAVGAAKGLMGLVDAAKEASAAFVAQEKAARGASDSQVAFAEQVQRALGVGDEMVLRLMQQARLLGVNERALDDVALAAIGMSEATGQQAASALQTLATDEKKLAESLDTARRGLELKTQAMGDLDGVLARSSNAFRGLQERVGELLAPMQKIVHSGLAVFAETAQQALVPAINLVNSSLQQFGDLTQWAAKGAIAYVTAVEVGWSNIGTVIDMALKTGELAILNFVGNVKHAFTVALPEYGAWLGRNWINLFVDIGNAVATIWQNMVQKLGNVIFEFWMFVENGFEGGLGRLGQKMSAAIQGSLLDGFEASTEALPEIIARKLTGRELQLADQVGRMGNKLAEEFNNKFQARIQGLNAPVKFDLADAAGGNALSGGASAASGQLTAVQGRLLTRGPGEDPLTKIEDHTKRTADGIEKMHKDMLLKDNPNAIVQFEEVK